MKIAKLSLVAAIAVAGLSNVQASSLESAIKGVDISGKVRYRYTETGGDVADDQQNDYDIDLTAKIPVNDYVKAIVKVDVDGDLSADGETGEAAEADPSVNIDMAYFSFVNQGFVLNAGKQAIPGPFTDSRTGTGLVAMAPVGPVTVAGAYFNANEKTNYVDLYAAGLLAGFENVNLEAWYADADDLADIWNLKADGQVGPVSLEASYSEMDEDANDNDYSTFFLKAGADIGMFDVHAGYAQNGDDGAADFVGDGTDAANNDFGGEIVDITTANDMYLWNVGASVKPVSKVTVGLDYYAGEGDTDDANDVEYYEIKGSVAYQMSKNFKITTWYAVANEDTGSSDTDTNKGRLELKYTF